MVNWHGTHFTRKMKPKLKNTRLDQRAGLNWIEHGIVEAMEGSILDFIRLISLFWIIRMILKLSPAVVELHSKTAGVNPTDRPTIFETHIDTNSETQVLVSDTQTNESIRVAN